jgi:hypothetical protein
MRHLAFLAATFALAGCATPAATFERQVLESTSPETISCGFVPYGQEMASASECVTDGASRKVPFVVAVQVRGTDSEIWEAYIQASDGSGTKLRYDSDRTGGSGLFASPRSTSEPCASPEIRGGPEPGIFCSIEP